MPLDPDSAASCADRVSFDTWSRTLDEKQEIVRKPTNLGPDPTMSSFYPQSGNSSLQEIPPNLTNPICVGTASLLADEGSTDDAHSGTNDSFPIPLE